MSRFVNWSITLLLSRFNPVIVFAPALDFNYLKPYLGPASATIHEITRNRTNTQPVQFRVFSWIVLLGLAISQDRHDRTTFSS